MMEFQAQTLKYAKQMDHVLALIFVLLKMLPVKHCLNAIKLETVSEGIAQTHFFQKAPHAMMVIQQRTMTLAGVDV